MTVAYLLSGIVRLNARLQNHLDPLTKFADAIK